MWGSLKDLRNNVLPQKDYSPAGKVKHTHTHMPTQKLIASRKGPVEVAQKRHPWLINML